MRKNGMATREKILDSATALIMDAGYGGTTVDEIIEKAGITKGAFFYHFKSKEILAQAIVDRYVKTDFGMLDDIVAAAEKKSFDPLQQLFSVVDQYIAILETNPHPEGCLYAAFCYESGLLENRTIKPIQDAVLYWRKKIAAKITAAATAHPPRLPIDANALADYFLGTFEGGYVLARTLKQPEIIVEQLKQFRTLIAALFTN